MTTLLLSFFHRLFPWSGSRRGRTVANSLLCMTTLLLSVVVVCSLCIHILSHWDFVVTVISVVVVAVVVAVVVWLSESENSREHSVCDDNDTSSENPTVCSVLFFFFFFFFLFMFLFLFKRMPISRLYLFIFMCVFHIISFILIFASLYFIFLPFLFFFFFFFCCLSETTDHSVRDDSDGRQTSAAGVDVSADGGVHSRTAAAERAQGPGVSCGCC